MRAHTITTMIAACACVLAISGTASAAPSDSAPYSSVNSITGGSSESSQSTGSQNVDPGYSSLNAITGAPSSEPTVVSTEPGNPGGFDWGSAAIGAGAAMALVALSGAVLLTLRRRTAVSPSAASIS